MLAGNAAKQELDSQSCNIRYQETSINSQELMDQFDLAHASPCAGNSVAKKAKDLSKANFRDRRLLSV